MDIILGTAQLTRRYGVMASRGPSRADRALQVQSEGRLSEGQDAEASLLAVATELGIRTIDTAPAYGDAETVIGRAGSAFAVHTKLPGTGDPALELEASLERLGRTSVEVLHLHDPDAALDPKDLRLEAAAALVGQGAKMLGASVYTPPQFAAAVADPRIGAVQLPLNVLDRRIPDAQLQRAASTGTRLIARSALLQGLLGDPQAAMGRVPALDESLEAFRQACRTLGRGPVEVALQWVRARPGISALVLGAEHPTQLRALVAALAAPPLTAEEQGLLDTLPRPGDQDVDPRRWSLRHERQGER
jgi:aryl-alcohol dehydrogenase-like predicted oxidoreductase